MVFASRWVPPEEMPVGDGGCWQEPVPNVQKAGASLVVEYM